MKKSFLNWKLVCLVLFLALNSEELFAQSSAGIEAKLRDYGNVIKIMLGIINGIVVLATGTYLAYGYMGGRGNEMKEKLNGFMVGIGILIIVSAVVAYVVS